MNSLPSQNWLMHICMENWERHSLKTSYPSLISHDWFEHNTSLHSGNLLNFYIIWRSLSVTLLWFLTVVLNIWDQRTQRIIQFANWIVTEPIYTMHQLDLHVYTYISVGKWISSVLGRARSTTWNSTLNDQFIDYV